MAVTYRNSNTGDVYHLAGRDPQLDALANWRILEDAEVPAEALAALEIAAAERRILEEAAQHRLAQVKDKADASVSTATTLESGVASGSPVVPTAVHHITPPADRTPVLEKNQVQDRISREELEARAAYDLANPPTTSVLQRAYADQRAGRTQIGDNPDEHPVGQVAAAAQGAHDVENPPAGGVLERDEAPKRNAARAEWLAYAEARGANPEAVAEMTRDQLAVEFGK